MAMVNSVSVSRFKGCLLGVLIGDCLGAPFEGCRLVSTIHLNNYFNQLFDPKVKIPFKPFTDDTAMTKSVALSLIHCKEYNAKDMARRFVTEFIKEPKRGYGASIGDVFRNLRLSDFEDPYDPAKRQFQGMGSYGNGAAMRIAPMALYAHEDIRKLTELTTLSSKITHSNKLGYRGAILQALAIRQALYLQTDNFDVIKFADELIEVMSELESKDPKDDDLDPSYKGPTTSYVKKLEIVKSFLSKPEPPPKEEVDELLGVHVSAHRSVPTALYCFLAAQKPLADIDCDNKFQRCIQYAFSLGGDTDTIGSMAGAIAGAHLGLEGIPQELLKHCEGAKDVLRWAEDLFAISHEDLIGSSKSAV